MCTFSCIQYKYTNAIRCSFLDMYLHSAVSVTLTNYISLHTFKFSRYLYSKYLYFYIGTLQSGKYNIVDPTVYKYCRYAYIENRDAYTNLRPKVIVASVY